MLVGGLQDDIPRGSVFTTMTRTANHSSSAHHDPNDVGPSLIRYFEYGKDTPQPTDVTQCSQRVLVNFYIPQVNARIAARHGDIVVLDTGLQHISAVATDLDPDVRVFGAGYYAIRNVLSAGLRAQKHYTSLGRSPISADRGTKFNAKHEPPKKRFRLDCVSSTFVD